MLGSSRGSATVEVALSGALLSLLITGLVSSAYIGFAHIWIKHSSYEAAVCLASQEHQFKCRQKLEQTINGVLLGQPLRNVQLTRHKKKARVSFEVAVFANVLAREERTLTLPLRRKKESRGDITGFEI